MRLDPRSVVSLVAGGALAFVSGCSNEHVSPTPVATAAVADNPPPSIDATQLAYDPNSRTVHFYDLIADPKTGRKAMWELWLPDGTTAYPSGKTFQFRHGVEETGVLIKAYDPPGPPSVGVKLSDVPRKK